MFGAAVVLLSIARRTAALVMNTPTDAVAQCSTVELSWSGGVSPYYPEVTSTDTAFLLEMLDPDGTRALSGTWLVSVAAGAQVIFEVYDASGSSNVSDIVTVQGGTDASCLGQISFAPAGDNVYTSTTTVAGQSTAAAETTAATTTAAATTTSQTATSASPSSAPSSSSSVLVFVFFAIQFLAELSVRLTLPGPRLTQHYARSFFPFPFRINPFPFDHINNCSSFLNTNHQCCYFVQSASSHQLRHVSPNPRRLGLAHVPHGRHRRRLGWGRRGPLPRVPPRRVPHPPPPPQPLPQSGRHQRRLAHTQWYHALRPVPGRWADGPGR